MVFYGSTSAYYLFPFSSHCRTAITVWKPPVAVLDHAYLCGELHGFSIGGGSYVHRGSYYAVSVLVSRQRGVNFTHEETWVNYVLVSEPFYGEAVCPPHFLTPKISVDFCVGSWVVVVFVSSFGTETNLDFMLFRTSTLTVTATSLSRL